MRLFWGCLLFKSFCFLPTLFNTLYHPLYWDTFTCVLPTLTASMTEQYGVYNDKDVVSKTKIQYKYNHKSLLWPKVFKSFYLYKTHIQRISVPHNTTCFFSQCFFYLVDSFLGFCLLEIQLTSSWKKSFSMTTERSTIWWLQSFRATRLPCYFSFIEGSEGILTPSLQGKEVQPGHLPPSTTVGPGTQNKGNNSR